MWGATSRSHCSLARRKTGRREINLHLEGYRFDWQFNVLRDDQVNAFCLPGGRVGVFTGLLRVWLQPRKRQWLKPNLEKPRERGSTRFFVGRVTRRQRRAWTAAREAP